MKNISSRGARICGDDHFPEAHVFHCSKRHHVFSQEICNSLSNIFALIACDDRGEIQHFFNHISAGESFLLGDKVKKKISVFRDKESDVINE